MLDHYTRVSNWKFSLIPQGWSPPGCKAAGCSHAMWFCKRSNPVTYCAIHALTTTSDHFCWLAEVFKILLRTPVIATLEYATHDHLDREGFPIHHRLDIMSWKEADSQLQTVHLVINFCINSNERRYLYTYIMVLDVTSLQWRMIMTAARLFYSNTAAVHVRCYAVDHWRTDTYEIAVWCKNPK